LGFSLFGPGRAPKAGDEPVVVTVRYYGTERTDVTDDVATSGKRKLI